MVKGTAAFGRHSGKTNHTMCRRCGNHSYHKRKGICASCGFGKTKRLRRYAWNVKIPAFYGHKIRNGRKEMFARKVKGKHTKKH